MTSYANAREVLRRAHEMVGGTVPQAGAESSLAAPPWPGTSVDGHRQEQEH